MVRSLESSCWFRWRLSCWSEAKTDIWHPGSAPALGGNSTDTQACSTHWQLSVVDESSPYTSFLFLYPHFQLLVLRGMICSHQELEVSPQCLESFLRQPLPAEGMEHSLERGADTVTATTATRRKARLPPPAEAVDVLLICNLELLALLSQLPHPSSSQL